MTPNGGGLPYKSWDRAGRDMLAVILLLGVGGTGTGTYSLLERSAELRDKVVRLETTIHERETATRRHVEEIARVRDEMRAELFEHQGRQAHDGAIARLARLEALVDAMSR